MKKRKDQETEELIHQNLVENYEKYYRLAYSYVHNEADAQDIVQEAAYKAIFKSSTLKSPEYAGTWIYRIMVNEALCFLRKNSRVQPEAEMEAGNHTDHYRDFDLEEAIESLEPLEKTIITLRFFEDFKLEQIALVTNENISTVKSRLYRALRKLRISLAD